MRGEKSWAAAAHEITKMSSILELPARGSDVTVVITKVHLHPLCVLVEFWGKFCQERTTDYDGLAKDIQSPGNAFREFEGNPGDQCLVQVDGTWHRARIVSRNGLKYNVFLIDKGITYSTTTNKLAWGKKKHFHMPPEVEFCVLANVLPLSPENRWSPVAFEFLKSLCGKSVKAHVQDVLVVHRTFLLHIPCISKQMYEMGIAKKLSPDMFQDFVLMSLQSHRGLEVAPETLQTSMGAGDQLHKQEVFMHPELPAGTVETVIVTDVTNPQRIFCQLKVFSQELKKLSEQITQCCEGRMTSGIIGPEMIGCPCAARGSDGRWYRSVLQQVFPTSKFVEVLHIDYGTKQFVQAENVRPLAAEFFRMPVVTYICSLHGIIDKGVGWTTNQIDFLRNLLLHKAVIAKFEYQSISEGVHYVTLYGDENVNINKLFGSKESCSLECEKTLGDFAIRCTPHNRQQPAQPKNQKKMITSGMVIDEKEAKGAMDKLPVEELTVNSSHVAVVQHVSDPSEFWIQTQNYEYEFDELMDNMYHLYKDSRNEDVVKNPTTGFCCAAKTEDGSYYRATVAEVGETQIKVFFVDYGNTKVVDRANIRTLPDKFKKLPCLALKCTLAGIRPKDGKWNPSALEFFVRAVTGKVLNVFVAAKCDDGYAVQLTDPEAKTGRDLSTLLCSSGFAERAETGTQTNSKMTTQPPFLPSTQLPDARHSDVYRNNGMSLQTPDGLSSASNERRIPAFKEHMFPSGSVLDVNVSFIASPNDFWCQLVQNSGHLKLLMHDIQAYYADSEFQPVVGTACVARHPDNGMWYRALVLHKHETPQVDVLFVDYGQTETVSLFDLRRICPEFLTLHGQAFRCSLFNPADPMSATNEWNEEAIARFHNFVETAASNFVILKCTIYAVMYSEKRIVFNIVDLETPFESISTSMVNLVKSVPSKKAAGPSLRLDTYYYSTHNIKTGTEEQVTVTCVNSVSQFYCQLARNADVIKDLNMKLSDLCHQLENVKLPTVFGTLCFAKYTDGQWYRGQIKATKPVILVHFVDYGDTIEVQKSDLFPVPKEAADIMSVPVQAVACSLSDIPNKVPSKVNSWFETNATECKFRALVVAREPDGKLLVELYHGKTQINAKIKKMFQIEMHSEEKVVCQSHRAFRLETSAKYEDKTHRAVPKRVATMEDSLTQASRKNFCAPKPTQQMRDPHMTLQSATKHLRHVCENSQRDKGAPLQLYRPPHQRHLSGRTQSDAGNGSEPAGSHIKSQKSLPAGTGQLVKSNLPGPECQKQGNIEKLPKPADLPSKSVTSGMEADVYVSHCNSPLSFYVQLVREEDEIFSLVEKLNDRQSIPQTNDIKHLQPGDLVQAEFVDDSSWYRAVVVEVHGNDTALVEFVDFGNAAVIPTSKIGRLHKSFLQLPLYSTHCMLSDAAALGKEEVLDPKVVSAFKEDIGGTGEKVLKCQFIRQTGSVWQVSLEDGGVNVSCKVPTTSATDGCEIAPDKFEQVEEKPAQISDTKQVLENSEKLLPSSCSPHYKQQEFSEGQRLEAYITSTNAAQTFWCQSTDSEELDKMMASISDVLHTASHKDIDPDSLHPGSPCLALFSDDHLWYRAEVINKDGDELSVLFIDYGNISQVKVTDVSKMPPDMMETPPLAFLCELEGFDASNGCWDSGAVEELLALTADKALQLTVTRVIREEGKIKYFVQVECEGQFINEALKTWWKSSTTVNEPGTVGLTTSNETPLQCSSDVKDTVLPEGQVDDTRQENDIEEKIVEDRDQILSEGSMTSEMAANDMEPVSGDVISSSMESSCDIIHFSDSTGERDDGNGTISRDNSLTRTSTVTMVPREAVCLRESADLLETSDGISEDLKQTETGLLPAPCVPPAFDASTEQENEGGEHVSEEEVPCVATAVENDLVTEDRIVAHHDDTYSAFLADTNTAPSEPGPCADPSQDLSDSVEEACLPDVCTDANEPSDDCSLTSARDNGLSRVRAEEMVQNDSLPPCMDLPHEQVTESPPEQEKETGDISLQDETLHNENNSETEEEASAPHTDQPLALSCDTEPQASTDPSLDLSYLVEEVTCLVRNICLKDFSRDLLHEMPTEESEQQLHTSPQQTEDCSDGSPGELVSSSPDDSFESQLSQITHLSLIITDDCADIQPAEQQPEE